MDLPPELPGPDKRVNIKNFTCKELEEQLRPFGIPEKQARQVMARVISQNSTDLSTIRGISLKRQVYLKQILEIPRLELVEKVTSPIDHFTRFLFRTWDGHLVESVRIPLEAHRYSICLSSQVGCALGCVFCATGKLGFKRNLEPWEMVDQVLQVGEGADRPVTGAVFMGQGEPFLNYDNVIKAAYILRDPTGAQIKAENITISTAGIEPNIRRFTAEGHPFRLIVSLSAATSEKRRRIMPIEKKYPLPTVIAALADYARVQKTRATIAWVAMEGINTSEEDIQELRQLIEGIPIRLNLIEVNDPSGEYVAPVGESFRQFAGLLQTLHVPIVRRYTGGKDVAAACGMLASTRQNSTDSTSSIT